MKIIEKLCKLYKRFKGYPEVLHNTQCLADLAYDDVRFFCVKNNGHFGSHKTYTGKTFIVIDLPYRKKLKLSRK